MDEMPRSDDDRALQWLHLSIVEQMDNIRRIFHDDQEIDLTVVVRNSSIEDADCVVTSEDDLTEAIRVIREFQRRDAAQEG